MADENAQLVRNAFAAWDRQDAATLIEAYDPEVELVVIGELNAGVYRGAAEVMGWFEEEARDVWRGFEYDLVDVTEWGPHVVVKSQWRGKSRSAGMPAEGLVLQIWTVRAGRIVRGVVFPSEEMSEGWGPGEAPAG